MADEKKKIEASPIDSSTPEGKQALAELELSAAMAIAATGCPVDHDTGRMTTALIAAVIVTARTAGITREQVAGMLDRKFNHLTDREVADRWRRADAIVEVLHKAAQFAKNRVADELIHMAQAPGGARA